MSRKETKKISGDGAITCNECLNGADMLVRTPFVFMYIVSAGATPKVGKVGVFEYRFRARGRAKIEVRI